MQILYTIEEIQEYLSAHRQGKKVGLVPTMGALHEGHLELIRTAKKTSDLVVATIFVNPAQFNNPEDLEKYPIQTEKDLELLQSVHCDIVFIPKRNELYPHEPSIRIDFGSLETELEGKFRPGHFAGVGLIISKLYNIITPEHAYFGQKDIQQFHVIKKLTSELNFQVQVHMVPTVREQSGLAMSSRNLRLDPDALREAKLIFESLKYAQSALIENASLKEIKVQIQQKFLASPLTLEYFEVVDTNDFLPLQEITEPKNTALCMAAVINNVRLIDNLPLIA